MRIGHLVIGVLAFSILIIGMGMLIDDLNSKYGNTVDSSFINTYNQIAQVGNLSQEITSTVAGSKIDTASPAETLSTGMLSAAKLVYEIPSIISSFFQDLFFSNLLPIPPAIRIALLAMILATITFLIISLVFRYPVI